MKLNIKGYIIFPNHTDAFIHPVDASKLICLQILFPVKTFRFSLKEKKKVLNNLIRDDMSSASTKILLFFYI